ncbi:tRNA-dihydrouridine synthase [Chromobacterium sp. ASV23]|uniref:tRNA dihydrouridine synthase n=1 Tax=Chromobacterium sp. ASV23 TaxID=2795110 RepID=UPI0018EE3710|nr:tRNA-dihydrouridine synthase [Chromobacterium sp. ASV23]
MKLVLAPMEGLVDDVMRDVLTRIGGIDLCVTEFVRVTSVLLPTRTFMRLAPELAHGGKTRAGVPVRVQLLGSDPACLAENGAKAAALGAPGVDLNFGCPAPTVNRHRGGAVLLNEPELLHQIVAATRRAVPADIPVTAKMRLGYEDKSRALECAQAIASAGADELTVHGRTKVEGYKPPAHWDWIARIREALTIPVIANGEVWTLDDYRAIRAESGCGTVMIGRGLVACPDLAARIIAGGPAQPMAWADMLPWVEDFFCQCWQKSAENRYPAARLKQWLGLLKRSWPEAAELFEHVRREQEAEKIEDILKAKLGK